MNCSPGESRVTDDSTELCDSWQNRPVEWVAWPFSSSPRYFSAVAKYVSLPTATSTLAQQSSQTSGESEDSRSRDRDLDLDREEPDASAGWRSEYEYQHVDPEVEGR